MWGTSALISRGQVNLALIVIKLTHKRAAQNTCIIRRRKYQVRVAVRGIRNEEVMGGKGKERNCQRCYTVCDFHARKTGTRLHFTLAQLAARVSVRVLSDDWHRIAVDQNLAESGSYFMNVSTRKVTCQTLRHAQTCTRTHTFCGTDAHTPKRAGNKLSHGFMSFETGKTSWVWLDLQ